MIAAMGYMQTDRASDNNPEFGEVTRGAYRFALLAVAVLRPLRDLSCCETCLVIHDVS
jgi:hypothetical protein